MKACTNDRQKPERELEQLAPRLIAPRRVTANPILTQLKLETIGKHLARLKREFAEIAAETARAKK
jgi:hypothetical protein